jgi:N-acetyl-anhydromuramyl-L-alanine amidase AmpD
MIIYDTPQTKNPCYQKGRPMRPINILVHSTGANNPWLKRYVDAPEVLGVNEYGNHWNKETATKCMHAFIGKDVAGQVAVAHTLPYNVASWGCGKGDKGSYNRDPVGHIQFEICEDGLTNEAYYKEAFGVAEEYCTMLCQKFGFDPMKITSHYEAAALGYASNHGDPRHWMRKFDDSMDAFRARVAVRLGQAEGEPMSKTILSFGSSGDQVRWLQTDLIRLGYDLGKWGADGKFGSQTAKAVREFQAAYGMPVTGAWSEDDEERMAIVMADQPEDKDMVLVPRAWLEELIALVAKMGGTK